MLYLLSRGVEKFSIVSGGVHHQYHYCLGGYLAGNDVQGVKSTQLLIHRGCILIKWNSPMESPSLPMDVRDINVCLLSAKKKSASSPSLTQLDNMSLW